MSNIKEIVGARIRDIRKERGLSQEELAHIANLHPTYIGKLERGERNMSVESLDKATSALGISLEELFKNLHEPVNDQGSLLITQIVKRLYGRSIDDKKAVLKLIDVVLELKDK